MPTWLIVLLVIAAIYIVGTIGFFCWLPSSPQRGVLAVLWPFTVLWMIFGNVQ